VVAVDELEAWLARLRLTTIRDQRDNLLELDADCRRSRSDCQEFPWVRLI
jgi:hypothetical protein